MKILVTSGGTREKIDDVRVLTNISTGKLGAKIASTLSVCGHNVIYLHTKGAVLPGTGCRLVEIDTVSELKEQMEKLVKEVDVVVHSMAVSDFGFTPTNEKLSSKDPMAFIESLKSRIVIHPKVISHIKEWNPNVILFGFKFTVGKTLDERYEIVKESFEKNKCDFILSNDKKEMVDSGTHKAILFDKDMNGIELNDKSEIAHTILKTIEISNTKLIG